MIIDNEQRSVRTVVLRAVVLVIFGAIVLRLGYIQLLDGRYDELARNNFLRYEVKYPPRGEVFDRNGEYLVQSKECYDLMVVYRDLPKTGFDTARLCRITGMTQRKFETAMRNARARGRVGTQVTKFLTSEEKLQLDEMNIAGFYTVPRTVRQYPRKIGGNLLGSVGEVSPDMLRRYPEYNVGDYIGTEGVEAAYEPVLRGEKGLILRDIYARGGSRDSVLKNAVRGKSIVCTIDARLQQFAEELMAGKVGAVVAIEPATGEILVMASSPTFDPDELVGRERGNNYMKELNNKRHPLFNRSVKAKYPPGSTFKLVNGLIGMQEGVLTTRNVYPCHRGYDFGRVHVGCHHHSSPLGLHYAIATSCNAYFCYVFRNILENRRYPSLKDAYDEWREYVLSFGFGDRLGSDFLGEGTGYVPTREFYDRRYRRSWNALTVLSLSIGQGELGCTPLQMANLAATVANRGYYYIPHIVRSIEGQDSLDTRFYERHYTKVDTKYFDEMVEGMWRGVNVDGTGRLAYLKDLDVCGKTGTAQNPRGADHSTFISFAPRNNPRIAIAVYVEHGGFGAEAAVPIASLIEEMYLTGEVKRPELVEYVKNKHINYSMYGK